MPNVSDFYLDHGTGRMYFEMDDGTNRTKDLSVFSTEIVNVDQFLTGNPLTTNQRDSFVAALASVASSGKTLLVDKKVFIDVTGGNEIYFPSQTTKIVFTKDGEIIGRWDTNPLFVILHSKAEIDDLKIKYDGPGLDASVNYSASPGQDPGFAVQNRVKAKMISDWGNTFSGAGNAIWYGPHPYMAAIALQGQASLSLNGSSKFYVDDSTTADNFIPWVISGKGQWKPGLTGITTSSGNLTPNANIVQPSLYTENMLIDGAYMGVQGEFASATFRGTRGIRYSDLMDASGNNIGGVGGNSTPPPHLFYINERNGNINIIDTIDYGVWVTTNADPKARRNPAVGSCCSLKYGCQTGMVMGYQSYRPDGFADLLGDQSGYGKTFYTVSDFYAEYDSSVCGNLFPSIRFPSPPYIGCVIQNGKLVDTATQTIISVIGGSTDAINTRIVIKNVEVEMQDYGGTNYPGTYFNGSNHNIDVRYKFKSHTQTQTARGVICYQGAAGTGVSNSRHRAEVHGWRNFFSDVSGLKNRIIMDGGSGGTNGNNNTAELIDVSNGYVATQQSGFKRERWTQSQVIPSAAGASITTALKIPANWTVVEIACGPKVNLGTTGGLTGFTIGWSGTPAGLGTITGTTTSARLASVSTVASTGADRTVVLTATGGTFDATGTIELVFTCEAVSLGE